MSNVEFGQLLENTSELTEQFKTEASKLFEDAVEAKAQQMISEQLEVRLAEQRDEVARELAEQSESLIEGQIAEKQKQITEQLQAEFDKKLETSLAESAEKLKAEYLSQIEQLTEQVTAVTADRDYLIADHEKQIAELNESAEKRAADIAAEQMGVLTERLVGYADYIAEQYVAAHEQPAVAATKVTVAEAVLESVRDVFSKFGYAPVEAHESFAAQLAEVTSERDKAYAQLAEAVEAKYDLERQVEESQKATAIAVISEGMTDVERSKLVQLMEGDTSDLEHFKVRAAILAESVIDQRVPEKTLSESAPLNVGSDNVVTETVPVAAEPKEEPAKEQPLEESIDPDVQYFIRALQSNKSTY